jgi:lipopolysaccharide export system permease protein
MKKLDKLIIRSFLGPFILTFLVVVFILLTHFLLKYIDDFVGKDLGFAVFSELIFYFSINMVPVALPLAILLSSLMTFGNLGEHRELTAIKSSGISLLRVLLPIFVMVSLLTVVAFFFNNYIVPRANIKAWSLLYDIRQKKPALDFKEGTFYKGLPNYSIKVNEKLPDGKTIKSIMIYDHTAGRGNTDVILADSGKMYTINNDRYLVLELFKGQHYSEFVGDRGVPDDEFVRNKFEQSKIVFNLSSFDLSRTREELFASNKIMRNIPELRNDLDSIARNKQMVLQSIEGNVKAYYTYQFRQNLFKVDTTAKIDTTAQTGAAAKADTTEKKETTATADKPMLAWTDSLNASWSNDKKKEILSHAANQARSIRSFTKSYEERVSALNRENNMYTVEIYKKYTQSLACLIMFLIGAPLGSIIKKGGLGVPIIISIVFFIIFYVFSMMGEKWAKEGVVEIPYGMWAANFILVWVGLFFLRKAHTDSALLESDYYFSVFRKIKNKFIKKKTTAI